VTETTDEEKDKDKAEAEKNAALLRRLWENKQRKKKHNPYYLDISDEDDPVS
jgi:hypothetical protein